MPAELEARDGYAIVAKPAGDFVHVGYTLLNDFDSENEARKWLTELLTTEREPGIEIWLETEDGFVSSGNIAAFQIRPAKVMRSPSGEPVRRRRRT